MRQVPVNEDELLRFAFRKIRGSDVYDAPNGNPIGQIDEGFTAVTVTSTEGDWVQINDGQWMPASQLAVARRAASPGFTWTSRSVHDGLDLLPTYPARRPARPVTSRGPSWNGTGA